nr:serine/threonine-protein kinase TIO isoform X2 [Ipomoea batatas]
MLLTRGRNLNERGKAWGEDVRTWLMTRRCFLTIYCSALRVHSRGGHGGDWEDHFGLKKAYDDAQVDKALQRCVWRYRGHSFGAKIHHWFFDDVMGVCVWRDIKYAFSYDKVLGTEKWIMVRGRCNAHLEELWLHCVRIAIEQDPVKYPDSLSSTFRTFLKGLLDSVMLTCQEIHAPEATAAKGNGNI